MKIQKTIPAAIAAAAFAFLSQVASADPVAQGGASAIDRQAAAEPQNSLTLIRNIRGAGARGMRTRGTRGMRTRGVRGTAVRGGPRTIAARRGLGPRRAFVGGRRFGPRRVRVWRNGRWVWGPAFGVGIAAGGGSCYWNCRNAGHGPGFCRANAGNFC